MNEKEELRIREIDARIEVLEKQKQKWQNKEEIDKKAFQTYSEIDDLKEERANIIAGSKKEKIEKLEKQIEQLKALKQQTTLFKRIKYNTKLRQRELELKEIIDELEKEKSKDNNNIYQNKK